MGLKKGLERSIRQNYTLIQDYTSAMQQAVQVKDKGLIQQKIDEHWAIIKNELNDYQKIEPNPHDWSPGIAQISKQLEYPNPLPGASAAPKVEINILSWNIAGAKMFNHLAYPPLNVTSGYIETYHDAWQQVKNDLLPQTAHGPKYPDIILLQECIGFRDKRVEPSGRWESGKKILQQIFRGYECFFFPALSSQTHPHPGKWQGFTLGNIRNFIPDYIEAQQGYGVCLRDPSILRKLWVTKEDQTHKLDQSDRPGSNFEMCFEVINLTPGLYLGNRDTEPRLMVMGRIKIGSPQTVERYINFVNIHLTTLKHEREGFADIDEAAQRIRLQQLDVLMKYTILAYQEVKKYRVAGPGGPGQEDIWILGGDFNALPDSKELNFLKKTFIDGNPDKRLIDFKANSPYADLPGTKWSLYDVRKKPITVDYILGGLKVDSFALVQLDISESSRPMRPNYNNAAFESDHAALFASFKI